MSGMRITPRPRRKVFKCFADLFNVKSGEKKLPKPILLFHKKCSDTILSKNKEDSLRLLILIIGKARFSNNNATRPSVAILFILSDTDWE